MDKTGSLFSASCELQALKVVSVARQQSGDVFLYGVKGQPPLLDDSEKDMSEILLVVVGWLVGWSVGRSTARVGNSDHLTYYQGCPVSPYVVTSDAISMLYAEIVV